MSRIGSVLGLVPRLPSVLRTLLRLRPAQARAQLRHTLFGLSAPRSYSGESPRLATDRPHTAFLVPPAHVKSDGVTAIEMLGTSFPIGSPIDWATSHGGPLFAYHLHQHEALRLPAFSPEARAVFIRDWIHHHESGVGWDPHPISLRLLCWGKLLVAQGIQGADADIQEEMIRSMASQAETLSHGLEIRLQANHLLSNLIGIVFTGMLFDGDVASEWRNRASDLIEELDLQVRPDGGHEERSPMYHGLLLEGLLDLLNLCRSDESRAPDGLVQKLSDVIREMLVALDLMTHSDGRPALFADCAFDIAARFAELRDYASRLGITPADLVRSGYLPQTGYFRLSAGGYELIASVAAPSPEHQPGHAHCDALAFELSVDGNRLVTDMGLYEYRAGRRRDLARATASHSTFEFDGREQAELWAAHRVGGRPKVELTGWNENGEAVAICRGWSRNAPLHRRHFQVDDEGVTIIDSVEGKFGEVAFCLPIDPAWQVELEANTARAMRDLASDESMAVVVEIELAECFEWCLERRFYYPTFGREVERAALVGHATNARFNGATTHFRRVE